MPRAFDIGEYLRNKMSAYIPQLPLAPLVGANVVRGAQIRSEQLADALPDIQDFGSGITGGFIPPAVRPPAWLNSRVDRRTPVGPSPAGAAATRSGTTTGMPEDIYDNLPDMPPIATSRLGPAAGSAASRVSNMRTGEAAEKPVTRLQRGGFNAPGDSANQIEAGLARSPIMQQWARVNAEKERAANAAQDESERRFISNSMADLGGMTGATSLSSLAGIRARAGAAQDLSRQRSAKQVEGQRSRSALDVANIGAGATLGAAQQRALAQQLASMLGFEGAKLGAESRVDAARVGAGGRVDAAKIGAVGRQDPLKNMQAGILEAMIRGDVDEAQVRDIMGAFAGREKSAPRVTYAPGVLPGEEPSVIESTPGGVTARGIGAVKAATAKSDLSRAAANIDTSNMPAGTIVPLGPGVNAKVGKDGKLELIAAPK